FRHRDALREALEYERSAGDSDRIQHSRDYRIQFRQAYYEVLSISPLHGKVIPDVVLGCRRPSEETQKLRHIPEIQPGDDCARNYVCASFVRRIKPFPCLTERTRPARDRIIDFLASVKAYEKLVHSRIHQLLRISPVGQPSSVCLYLDLPEPARRRRKGRIFFELAEGRDLGTRKDQAVMHPCGDYIADEFPVHVEI